jgi:hypothetical protein
MMVPTAMVVMKADADANGADMDADALRIGAAGADQRQCEYRSDECFHGVLPAIKRQIVVEWKLNPRQLKRDIANLVPSAATFFSNMNGMAGDSNRCRRILVHSFGFLQ